MATILNVSPDIPFPLEGNGGFFAEASELGIKAGEDYPQEIHYKGRTYKFMRFRPDNTAVYQTDDNTKFEILND